MIYLVLKMKCDFLNSQTSLYLLGHLVHHQYYPRQICSRSQLFLTHFMKRNNLSYPLSILLLAGQRCANPEQKYKETDKYFVPFIVCLIILILGIFAVIFNYCVGRMRSEKVNYSNRELGGRKGTLDITARKAATIFKTRTKSDATKTGKPLALQNRENSRHLLVDGQADNMGFTTGIDVQANTTEA